MGGKAADRVAKKQAMKQDQYDEPAAEVAPGCDAMITAAKQLVMDSILVKLAPQVPNFVIEGIEFHKAAKIGNIDGYAKKNKPADNGEEQEKQEKEEKQEEKEEKEEKREENEEEDKKEKVLDMTESDAIFDALAARLQFHNALGLGLPVSGEDSKDAWLNLKSLEFDGGPQSRKRGNPAKDRILANVQNNAAQYWHVLLAVMVLRAFLFRSFFACLPWLCVYQVLSLMIPRGFLEDKLAVVHMHIGLRIGAAMCVHALLWFFFLFEAVYRTYFMEKLLYVGVFVAHAYVVRPAVLCPVQ